jgi:hypothetical protein
MFGCLHPVHQFKAKLKDNCKEERIQTLSINPWTLNDIQSIMEPMMVCIGIIHDFLRPTVGK